MRRKGYIGHRQIRLLFINVISAIVLCTSLTRAIYDTAAFTLVFPSIILNGSVMTLPISIIDGTS